MFWTLLLAHLLADYPLQTDRMVLAKKHLPGLLLHVAIHLLVLIFLFLPVIAIAWPYLLVLAFCHFLIDAFKNLLGRQRPHWVIRSYVLDQILHLISLILVGIWMDRTTDLPVWPVISPWVIYVTGLLLATYIWFISERILVYQIDQRQWAVTSAMWPRMGVRLLLFVLAVAPYGFAGLLLFLAIIAVIFLYRRSDYLRSWLFIDVGVPAVCALAVRLVLWIWG
jgi:hypothetical protein